MNEVVTSSDNFTAILRHTKILREEMEHIRIHILHGIIQPFLIDDYSRILFPWIFFFNFKFD